MKQLGVPKISHRILYNAVNDDRINTEMTFMNSLQPKKLLIINILDILKKYTDEDHRLSQKEIAETLETEYEMKADRKAIKRNLMNLIEFGYEIEYSEEIRMIEITNEDGEKELVESYILSDFHLVLDYIVSFSKDDKKHIITTTGFQWNFDEIKKIAKEVEYT